MSSAFQAFPLRSPLGRGYPTHGPKDSSGQPSPVGRDDFERDRLAKAPRTKLFNSRQDAAKKVDRSVEEEYVRNLQQQIYLLELETRYLRGTGPRVSSEADVITNLPTSAPINESIRSLRTKYVDLQEKHRKDMKALEERARELETKTALQDLTIQSLEKEKAEQQMASARVHEMHSEERDQLVAEAITASKRAEQFQTERDCVRSACERMQRDRDRLVAANVDALAERDRFRDQLEEQVAVSGRLQRLLDELRRENSALIARLEEGEARLLKFNVDEYRAQLKEMQEERLRLTTELKMAETNRIRVEASKDQISVECDELLRKNTALSIEIEDLRRRLKKETNNGEDKIQRRQDQLRELGAKKAEIDQLKDEILTIKTTIESKERKIIDLMSKCGQLEIALKKGEEARTTQEELIAGNIERLENQEQELIRLGQDKSALVSEIAGLRNNYTVSNRRVANLTKELHQSKAALERCRRELTRRNDFDKLLREVTARGENYMSLMKSVSSFMPAIAKDLVDDSPGGEGKDLAGEFAGKDLANETGARTLSESTGVKFRLTQ